ncbi:MAG: alpha-amylase, partial [Chthoniobacterales bacterium]|nr:alpha-amylase [Chthoniobacterales bacterium]
AFLASASAWAGDVAAPASNVPDWGKSAVWYQIFPERFRNGDPSNDPTRDTLEMHFPNVGGWRVTPWNGDYFVRDEWEKAIGDSFYENGIFHRRYGGDLQGVIDKLDYLKDLGITAIKFNPVFYGRSQHKYDGNSFHHIDPNFGPDPAGDFEIIRNGGETADPATWKWTAADKLFLELVKKAHERGIRVVIDGVFNHTGRDFFAFRDIRINGEKSPYVEWFTIQSFDDPATRRNELRYTGWAGFFTLPEFRNNGDGSDLHPGPKQYIFDATRRWMDPDGNGDTSDGIDGWRLDVSEELPDKFWRDWNKYVFGINPRAITVAEVWTNAADYLKHTGFSATMNYYAFSVPVKAYLIDNSIRPSAFGDMLNGRREQLPVPVQLAMWNLTDSHDTDRVAQMIINRNRGGNYANPEKFDYDEPGNSARTNERYEVRKPNAEERAIQRLVTLFQLTYVGAPMFFYGVEAGVWGGDDPDCRKPMPWEDISMAPERQDPRGRQRPADDANFDKQLHGFFRDAIAVHAANAAFRTPYFSVLRADDDKNVIAYSRGAGDDLRVVVINRSDKDQTVGIPAPASKVVFTTAGSPEAVRVSPSAGACEVSLPPLTGAVFR